MESGLGARDKKESVAGRLLSGLSTQNSVLSTNLLRADGLKADAMRLALCYLPLSICVNWRESAVSS